MIYNYLKTAWRALWKHRAYTLLNVVGLVVGISFSCMLYIYISSELSFDTFHTKHERTFRILTIDQRDKDAPRTYGITVPALGDALIENQAEVEEMVRLYKFVGQVVFKIGDQNFQERSWYATDANFFEVFDFEFVSGDRATALREPHSLILTQRAAKKYFGGKDPLGETIDNTSFGPVKITGVVQDPPDNSHLQFDLLFSQVADSERWSQYLTSWTDFSAYTYIVLSDPNAAERLRTSLRSMPGEQISGFKGSVLADLQPMRDIHLQSAHIENGTESEHGQLSYIIVFSSMGVFLLIIACINYINLATSKAMVRSREVGVRKVAGARRGQLIAQFLAEALLMTFTAAVISIFVMNLLFPYFNQITGKSFDISTTTLTEFVPALSAFAMVIGIVSGSYPAFHLAGLKPVSSLKGAAIGRSGSGLRKALVVFQFVITIVMIVSTIVINRQMHFIQTKEIGFDKDRLMVVDINSGEVRGRFRTIKEEYAKIPGVERVAVSSRVPGEWKSITELYVKGRTSQGDGSDSIATYFMGFDEDMLDTYRLALKRGRYFTSSGNDSTNVLLNESAVAALGLEDPVGQTIFVSNEGRDVPVTVIGVLRDFNFQSLHQKISPIVIGAWNNPFRSIDYFSLKITGDLKDVIPAVTRVHERFDLRTPIEYHFMDEQLESFYAAEHRAGMIFGMAGWLSILVACLGLFGLATYNIERRRKELGIRKVHGASGLNLFVLLSSSVVKQVGIAFLIATPVAWYVMVEWLAVFEYKVSLHFGIFMLAGLIALTIALLTVSYRTLQAVSANPIKSLRQE